MYLTMLIAGFVIAFIVGILCGVAYFVISAWIIYS